MKSNKALIVVVVVALAVVGIAGYLYVQSSNQQAQKNQQTQEQELPEGTSKEPLPETQTKQFAVTAGNFYFLPSEIRVKKGDRVKIVLTSAESSHEFAIDELNARIQLVAEGKTGEVEFVAAKTGEFIYYCSVGDHRQLGQTGKLIVEE